ncbi:MAG: braB [Chlamydiales bacterium]|jgi:LIVCS family branched-chain amino acid:cation transporter|nr:braB [Chlamydiales bacterium]
MKKMPPSLTAGLALFAMFFGAGNVVFPLNLGKVAALHSLSATFGFLLTAVGIPFLGLFAVIAHGGSYRSFFNLVGKVPGRLILFLLMALIGPFGGAPRCITLSYATFKVYAPNLSLELYVLIAAALVFILSYRETRILSVLGNVLTPILLLTLSYIVYSAWPKESAPQLLSQEALSSAPFLLGIREGYQTMDLLASFFFASFALKNLTAASSEATKAALLQQLFKASLVAGALLSGVYVAFTSLGSLQSDLLHGVSQEYLLGAIAQHALGQEGALLAAILTALACLTTAIALVSIFASFLVEEKVFPSYERSLIATTLVTYLISRLEFQGIAQFLIPTVELIYPLLIVLSAFATWQQLRRL